MDILNIRTLLRTKSIYDIPLRVTFYARVSSDTDEQINSLDNQISYYEEFIQKNEKWTYVPGYVDEGLSGISTKKRKHFNEMIADAKEGMFDLIITKEISRFASKTITSIPSMRMRSFVSRSCPRLHRTSFASCPHVSNSGISKPSSQALCLATAESSVTRKRISALSSTRAKHRWCVICSAFTLQANTV